VLDPHTAAESDAWPRVEGWFDHGPLAPEVLDALWSFGWRHFGCRFFQYSRAEMSGKPVRVLPLRVDLSRWTPSRSQSRILRGNRDLEVSFHRPQPTEEQLDLFARHTSRFRENVPETLEAFVGPDPGRWRDPGAYPCDCVQVEVRDGQRLVAVSYLDLGRMAASSVYAFFDPEESRRSLGWMTFLAEIEHARARGCRYLYPGYAYLEPSAYDYKKRLGALEAYDWSHWQPWEPA
jgi:arginine-tRNA-protein transferase